MIKEVHESNSEKLKEIMSRVFGKRLKAGSWRRLLIDIIKKHGDWAAKKRISLRARTRDVEAEKRRYFKQDDPDWMECQKIIHRLTNWQRSQWQRLGQPRDVDVLTVVSQWPHYKRCKTWHPLMYNTELMEALKANG